MLKTNNLALNLTSILSDGGGGHAEMTPPIVWVLD